MGCFAFLVLILLWLKGLLFYDYNGFWGGGQLEKEISGRLKDCFQYNANV